MITKFCRKCGEEKPLDAYSKGQGKHKKSNVCRKCDAERRMKNYWSKSETELAEVRRRAKVAEYVRRYKVPVELAEKLSYNREGVCEVCGETKPLVVDHCHDSGSVRGLLCQQCNSMIGYAKDCITTLHNAIQYLQR